MRNDSFIKLTSAKQILIHIAASMALASMLIFFLTTIDRVQADSLVASLKAIFRNDNLLGNTAAVGRRIADLEALDVIECVTLNSKSIGEIYSTAFKDGCNSKPAFFNKPFVGSFTSLSGETIQYQLRIPRSFAFVLTFSVLTTSLFVVINGALLWLWSLNRTRERKLELLTQIAEQAEQVSHDIRSPLSALMFAVKGLSNLPEENRRIITLSTKRIDDIANDLLKKRSFDRNSPPLATNSTSVTMKQLISDVCIEKESELPANRRIRIKTDFGSDDVLCPVDSAQLSRMLSNLINNSIEAICDEGEITIGMRAGRNGRLALMVSDNGSGISEDILKKLGNEKLVSQKTGKSGSGIGLYFIKQRLSEMGGLMTIQSRLGVGTMITIQLPSDDGR